MNNVILCTIPNRCYRFILYGKLHFVSALNELRFLSVQIKDQVEALQSKRLNGLPFNVDNQFLQIFLKSVFPFPSVDLNSEKRILSGVFLHNQKLIKFIQFIHTVMLFFSYNSKYYHSTMMNAKRQRE